MPEISAEIRGLLQRNVACSTATRCNERPLLGFAGTYGRRALAAAGSRRRRGSVGAGHAGGASRVAELGARHAAAADDAVLEAAPGLLRARVRIVGESTLPPLPLRGPSTRRRSTTTRRPSSVGGGLPTAAPSLLGRSPRASSSPSRRIRRRASGSLRCFATCSASCR